MPRQASCSSYRANSTTQPHLTTYSYAYHVKQPWVEVMVKFDLTPEVGTRGNNTRGTFRAYCCFALHTSNWRITNSDAQKASSEGEVILYSMPRQIAHVLKSPEMVKGRHNSKPRGKMAADKSSSAFDERMSNVLSAIDTAMVHSGEGARDEE